MDKVTEILINAKEILESELDWCQFRMHNFEVDDSGNENNTLVSVCAVGAIVTATKRYMGIEPVVYRDAFLKMRMEVESVLKTHIPPNFRTIPHFNDDEGTSKEDVLLAFKRAIAASEERNND